MSRTSTSAVTMSPGRTGARNFNVWPRYTVPCPGSCSPITASILTPAANLLHFDGGLEFGYALVFAALISATDPIAVVSLFKTLGAPKRLAVLVEGESLLNDGTAVVFDEHRLTWHQFNRRINQLANALRTLGIGNLRIRRNTWITICG